jgi:hypothetical protein
MTGDFRDEVQASVQQDISGRRSRMRIEPSLGSRLFPACAMPGHAGLCFRGRDVQMECEHRLMKLHVFTQALDIGGAGFPHCQPPIIDLRRTSQCNRIVFRMSETDIVFLTSEDIR